MSSTQILQKHTIRRMSRSGISVLIFNGRITLVEALQTICDVEGCSMEQIEMVHTQNTTTTHYEVTKEDSAPVRFTVRPVDFSVSQPQEATDPYAKRHFKFDLEEWGRMAQLGATQHEAPTSLETAIRKNPELAQMILDKVHQERLGHLVERMIEAQGDA